MKYRSYCLEYYNDISPPEFNRKIIDEHFGLLTDRSDRYYEIRKTLMANMGYKTKSYKPIDCVIELLRYPRQLKRALASTWGAWQKLHGEIYFDDLLVIHTIKTSSCELFHFIVNNTDQFKVFANVNTKADNKELYRRVENILELIPKPQLLSECEPIYGLWTLQTNNGNGLPSIFRSPKHSLENQADHHKIQEMFSTEFSGFCEPEPNGRICRIGIRQKAPAIDISSSGQNRGSLPRYSRHWPRI